MGFQRPLRKIKKRRIVSLSTSEEAGFLRCVITTSSIKKGSALNLKKAKKTAIATSVNRSLRT